MKKRGSGILCHITSLPSPYGIGDLGQGAYTFADFLASGKQSYWQVLPLNPTNQRYADSPFTSMSSCAGNTVLIDPEALMREGLLTEPELNDHPLFSNDRADFAAVTRYKQHLFKLAHARFREREAQDHEYQRFCKGECSWLDDHALFTAIAQHLGQAPLCDWPEGIRSRNPEELQKLRESLAEAVDREKFLQFTFYRQWHWLKNYCNERGIQIIGDFPLFMNYDSVDIWVRPELFKVDEKKVPYLVAGSPPDAFSPNGQIFNGAVYDWDAAKKEGFSWWVRRFGTLFELFDIVRIDHFRGLISCWEVPAGDQNALHGEWRPTPTADFLNALVRFFPMLPVIAEDLGSITAEVREAMAIYRIPGIKVLLLAFQKDVHDSVYLPHNHVHNCVVYTGTHDTTTVTGWFQDERARQDREELFRYLGREVQSGANWELIRMAMMSVADTAIVQMQDVLGAGQESRMNTPGVPEGNWQWRFPREAYADHARTLAELAVTYCRAS